MTTKKNTQSWTKAMPRQITELQRVVEKQMQRTLDRATELLPPAPRKAIKRFAANVDRTRQDLRKRGEKAVADVRKRAEHLTADVEKRFKHAVAPLTERLDVASRAEVDRLRKRLEHLERRIATPSTHSSTSSSATA